ncbi:putative rRNA pseudouridine synthase [Histomonas meleagridis]|uniref:putative rRNA pseudouridine synthase n=1 Tax=Histomonas meleagridis TaxID=135588 RepID=UPI00355A7FE6|nr:putative rRNA pseudouridine synthase [Histomonas meleagridis]KAH0801924.1 putative rRNA pseudouridine synthase [Histomonas meleagridis]
MSYLDTKGNKSYFCRVVKPLEWMLTQYKRIVMKDSSVDAVCHGAKVMIPGILRFENGIEVDEVVVIITTKGEAIALGIALTTSEQMYNSDHEFAAKIKRVIMDRGTCPKCWGKGYDVEGG